VKLGLIVAPARRRIKRMRWSAPSRLLASSR
jgi:hypothetical protein